ncbi:5-formyltetrahydrofolate cyclo-ligase family protein [Rickettsiales bacterium Ac37b]|nr:5-formyltetrahydrofolate cyclo-ligase family protein [Rickettsiales bacterium Ac37b]
MIEKKTLRAHYIKLRSLHAINNPEFLQKISENFFNILENYPKKSIIAGYLAMPGELNLLPLLQKAEQHGYRIAMPVVISKHSPLSFCLCGANPTITISKYYKNLPEPIDAYPYVMPDIVITPMLACDRQGTRLGYGGGLYDRTLASLRGKSSSLVVIGICNHNFLVNSELPHNLYDQFLDIIITDKEMITTRARQL